jgi:tRNA wybutosine-synthesizing protein 3
VEDSDSRAGPGGKGGGGAWLFISHDPVDIPHTNEPSTLSAKFGLEGKEERVPGVNSRYIHLKFEPMVSSMLALLAVS